MVAAVVTHDNTWLTVGECLVDVIGKALCGLSNDVDIHAIGAHAHDAAQTACAEFQTLIEGVDEGCLVLCFEHSLHFCLGLCVINA